MSTTPKHHGLGRGLDALIKGGGGNLSARAPAKTGAGMASAAAAGGAAAVKGAEQRVEVGRIVKNPWQPRREFAEESLRELADSIATKGVLQPILVRRKGAGFELIAGERRWRAAQLAGLKEVPVLVKDASDLEVMELALIENIQRSDLNPVEEAEGYRLLMGKAGLTQEALAKRVGKARATITNALRLLELPAGVLQALAQGLISTGHAKVLLGAAEGDRELLLLRTVKQGLSVRALERLVAGLAAAKGRGKGAKVSAAPAAVRGEDKMTRQLKSLADRMQQELGTKVMLAPARQLADGKREMGRIVIEFFDSEDLSRLLETLNLGDLT